MKLLIVGGVAGGASAAARARRLDEQADIVMFERGEFVSFANCGLPYHVGNVIAERSSLMVMTPEKFKARVNIDVRTLQEVISIDRAGKSVAVRNVRTGEEYTDTYDKLILATGSTPVRPAIPGADDPDVMQLWTIPDMDRIKSRVDQGARRAVVVGAGFIGLEVVENLRERGLDVRLVELLPQVLPTLDAEMSQLLTDELQRNGVDVRLGRKVVAIRRVTAGAPGSAPLAVSLDDDTELAADLVIMAIGVRPNSALAGGAGLELTDRKGIAVDDHMRTSDPDIYAVGDVVSVTDFVEGSPTQIPLAGPANRQGRIAADNVTGRDSVYRGTLGTSVVKVFDVTAASVGMTERRLKAADAAYEKIYIHPASNATYYPGAAPLAIKLLFDADGRILGAQVVGERGVDKRVDVIATAMRGGMTVYDLEELELAYAPPYSSAKDPVNFAGMVAANVLRGDTDLVHCDSIPEGALLLDVREPAEYELGHINGAAFIPLGQLRDRLGELPRDRKIIVYCKVGLRGYLAERILKQNGFDAANLSGSWLTWKLYHPDPVVRKIVPSSPSAPSAMPEPVARIDLGALQCPGPIVRLRQELSALAVGDAVLLSAGRAFRPDLESWCHATGNELLSVNQSGDTIEAVVRKGGESAMSTPTAKATGQPETAAIVVFSNDLDKVLAAFIIATGLSTLGTQVSMFFTFWGLNVLRKENPPSVAKDLLSRMFGWMMPRGPRKLALSKMHMMGMGTTMMKYVMNRQNVVSLPELMNEARELGVRFIACDMAMNVMGLQQSELIEVDDVAGVASFAALAKDSGTVLFI